MEITFNNTSQQIEDSTSVVHLLQKLLGDKLQGIAVAVNQNIIPKAQWETFILQQHDNILVIKAAQGG
ncbi:sulfur carrier protein ThiS [Segetibacter koreensis]|uniref:sulfur carrier protein ThiS n=1 Tax=Segetibacter koreensis TaxID=398037 RepID=UPI0003747667|nr:sulfur carrier protein ThiS [Segetibacter koreensis]